MGCRQLQDLEIAHVEVDPCGDSQSAAEGAVLGLFEYDELKSKKKTPVTPQLFGRYRKSWCCECVVLIRHRRAHLNTHGGSSFLIETMCDLCRGDDKAWAKGVLYGEGQNLARKLMEAPANHITPTVFADIIEQKLTPFSDKVTVHKRYLMMSWLPLSMLFLKPFELLLYFVIRLMFTEPSRGSRASRWGLSSVCPRVQMSPLSSWKCITPETQIPTRLL